jgi:acyl dehydratase
MPSAMVPFTESRYREGMDYFEDVEPGAEFEVGRHTPSKDEIVSFARQWDPQPFHLDEEAGRRSVMGGLSASSCHTYAISSLIYSGSDRKLKTAAMLGLQLTFPKPVRPDQELTLFETYLEKRISKSRPGLGILTSRTCMRNPDGEDVMVMESNFLVERRIPGE